MNRTIDASVAARIGAYSDAVEISPGKRLLFVSGTPGIDPVSGQLPESFCAQAELAWRNVHAILAQAGMGGRGHRQAHPVPGAPRGPGGLSRHPLAQSA
jgi:enamine deaminase RidA (YjgF/YER057c/UK114 family)